MKKTIIILSILFGLGLTNVYSIDIYDDISNAIKFGNSKLVAQHFGGTVDLTILSVEDVYSKTQAQIILNDFFSKNIPKSFSILHKGVSKDGATFVIGSLITDKGNSYRTYFFIKQVKGINIIQELRFEKQ